MSAILYMPDPVKQKSPTNIDIGDIPIQSPQEVDLAKGKVEVESGYSFNLNSLLKKNMYKAGIIFITFLSSGFSASCQRLYIKPQLNFQFPLVTTIRQDHLPFARIENHHRSAVIMPGLRIEYSKANGNGYFLNFSVLPLGYAARYTDYAYIDPSYRARSLTPFYAFKVSSSESGDIFALDLGFINRLATLKLSRNKSIDIKLAYGGTIAQLRPYSPYGNFYIIHRNSMNKEWELLTTAYPYFDPNKGSLSLMIPAKLNFNIKNKIRNIELLDLEIAYWQGLTHGIVYNLTYHNLTDNIKYENVIEAKGTTLQLSVLIPIRIGLPRKKSIKKQSLTKM